MHANSTSLQIGVALVAPSERAGRERQRANDWMTACARVRGGVPACGVAAADVPAGQADACRTQRAAFSAAGTGIMSWRSCYCSNVRTVLKRFRRHLFGPHLEIFAVHDKTVQLSAAIE